MEADELCMPKLELLSDRGGGGCSAVLIDYSLSRYCHQPYPIFTALYSDRQLDKTGLVICQRALTCFQDFV